jgi:Zn-dependent protease with chaperone function
MWRYAALAIATTSSAIACVGLFTSVPLSRVSSADRSLVESEIRPLASYELRDLYEKRYAQIRSSEIASSGESFDLIAASRESGYSPIDLAILTKQQIEGARSSLSANEYYKLRQAAYEAQESLARLVTRIGRRVAQGSDRPDLSFTLEPAIAMNAGAVAGFNPTEIYVGPQLVMLAQSDDALAFILAHEVAHHRQGHTRALAIQNLLVGTLRIAVSIAAGVAMAAGEQQGEVRYSPRQYQDSMSGAAALAGAVVNGAIRLTGYSRDQEREADYYGLRYATRAGYDPDAAADILIKLTEYQRGLGSSWMAPFLSDHPSNPERIVRLRQWAAPPPTLIAAHEEPSVSPLITRPPAPQSMPSPMASHMSAGQDIRTIAATEKFCWQGIGLEGMLCETCCEDGICAGECEVVTVAVADDTATRPTQCWNSDAFDGSQPVLCTTCCTASVSCKTVCATAD